MLSKSGMNDAASAFNTSDCALCDPPSANPLPAITRHGTNTKRTAQAACMITAATRRHASTGWRSDAPPPRGIMST
eukprot:5863402-Prymnesium_polylepis.2